MYFLFNYIDYFIILIRYKIILKLTEMWFLRSIMKKVGGFFLLYKLWMIFKRKFLY